MGDYIILASKDKVVVWLPHREQNRPSGRGISVTINGVADKTKH